MAKRSLIVLFIVAIAYVCIQLFLRPFFRGIPVLAQSLSLVYLWIPGIIGLIYARIDKVRFPVFARPNRYFYMIPIVTMAICLCAFLLSIPFGILEMANPVFTGKSFIQIIGFGSLFLITSYLFVVVLLGIVFLGGEIYWRGYLLEKWRGLGLFRSIWLIALFWSLWQIPIMALAYSPGLPNLALNILWTFVINFSLAPVLTYFRLKGKSVMTSAVFYSSFIASFLYFLVLFPTVKMTVFWVYGGLTLVGLIVFSAFLKLYSPAKWNKIS
ncbi:MAG: hypothetical protein P0S96_02165 [Simkaniaceae bacterium]|nr:hypothetical protein [Candidatus Sacchlamyda saccharinae]